VAIDLFHKLYRKGKPVRLLGVRLSELTNHAVQGSLFDDAEKKNNLYKAIDDVKNKYGKTLLKKARTVNPKSTATVQQHISKGSLHHKKN
jgi:DNA polymerase-4